MQLSNQKETASQGQINWLQRVGSKMLDKLVQANLGAQAPGAQKQDYIPKATDSGRVEQIQANLRGIAYRNDWTRVIIPGDDCGCGGVASRKSIQAAQERRELAFRREASTARFSQFMVTPTDAQRLNNPAQQSFVQQRQLTIPNTQSQFYAFMHALSAAFGSTEK